MKRLLAGALLLLASCTDGAPSTEELNYLLAGKKPSANAPSFSINDVSVSENGEIATLTITKTGSARSSSVVRARTVNATAVSPTDYTSFDQDVSFSKNTTSATVVVRVVDDETHESSETFRVVLTAGSNARIVDNTGIVTIADDDSEVPTTKPCPDGSVIPIADTCPDNPPEPDDPPPPEPDPEKDRVIIHGDDQSMYSAANWPGIYQSTVTSTVEVGSRAIGGTTISSLQSMLAGTLTNSPPNVLVMFYGTNDLVSPTWVSAQDWVDKYAAMIQQTQDASVKTVVVIPLPRCNNSTYNARRAEIIPLMVTQFGYNLVRTDQDARLSNGCNTAYFQSDGIHLTSGVSNTGHSVLAGLAGTKIDAVLAGGAQPDATQSPAPPPPPAPQPPPPVTGWVTSPNGLTGETFVAGGFTITEGYSTGKPIPVGATSGVGEFRFICGAGQLSYDDPIVYPGTAGQGKSHLHQYYGNLLADGNSTYTSLRTTGGSTCNQFGDGSKSLNRSAYWMPAMLDTRLNKVVKPDFVQIYYKRRPSSDPKCTASNFQAIGNCIALPNGLKFIFGYDMVTGKPPTGKAYYNCQGPGAVSGTYASLEALAGKCPPGAQVGAVIEAPSCWDGKHLDSPNHRDHVAYPSYGTWGYLKCPSTHPYNIATFQLGAWYTVGSGENPAVDWALSSDAMHPSMPRGHTFHADFWMAWDETVHKGAVGWEGPNGCVNKLRNCSAGDLGSGSQLNGAAVPIYGGSTLWKNPGRLVSIPAQP